MNIENIKSKIKNRKSKLEGKYNRFSVLVPIVKVNGELELLLEVRSETLSVQPNEICFPGGKLENNESPYECAIRETCEELNVSPNDIEVFGELDYLVLPSNLILYPYLGKINCNVEDIKFSKDEVSTIFTVPLKHFINHPALEHSIDLKVHMGEDFPYHLIQDGINYNWRTGKYPVLFYKYNDYIIWGITARIIKNLVELLKTYDL
ncbi:CoA pyrophosphatase [Lutibacter sp. B2]|nr:CoA pyrophosphatase [Lutibacter sp. B2]